MHEQFANQFYRSPAWAKCRAGYIESRRGLCERCAAAGLIVPGTEVHHKQRLTRENLTDPAITLNWDNLELLCRSCHEEEHRRKTDLRTDCYGHVDL